MFPENNQAAIIAECIFKTSRSSGKGGQHVNKTETKVQLEFEITASAVLSEDQKHILLEKLKDRLTTDGFLQISSQEFRSQLKNRKRCIAYILSLL